MTEASDSTAEELNSDAALELATRHVGEALKLMSHARNRLSDDQLASKALSTAFGRASAMLDVAGLMTENARRMQQQSE